MSIETFAGNIEPSAIVLPDNFHRLIMYMGVRVVGKKNLAKIELDHFLATEVDISDCGNEIEVLRTLRQSISNLEPRPGAVPVNALIDRKAIVNGIDLILDNDDRQHERMRKEGVEWYRETKNLISYPLSWRWRKVINTKTGRIVKISSYLLEDLSPLQSLRSAVLGENSE